MKRFTLESDDIDLSEVLGPGISAFVRINREHGQWNLDEADIHWTGGPEWSDPLYEFPAEVVRRLLQSTAVGQTKPLRDYLIDACCEDNSRDVDDKEREAYQYEKEVEQSILDDRAVDLEMDRRVESC